MRVSDHEFEAQIKQVLGEKSQIPDALEAALFAQAEDLLAKRRGRIASREAEVKRRRIAIRQLSSRVVELLAIRPEAPATAAILAALVVAFLTLHGGGREAGMPLSYQDLPALPKNNDVPARYDAQILAERQAYEREVEDAHNRTSGGI